MTEIIAPKVVNIRKHALKARGIPDFEHWQRQADSLYIGRNMSFFVKGTYLSKWHNPFKLNKEKNNVHSVLNLYERRIRETPDLFNSLHELNGKELGCWCSPEPCHGDILVKLFKEKFLFPNRRAPMDPDPTTNMLL